MMDALRRLSHRRWTRPWWVGAAVALFAAGCSQTSSPAPPPPPIRITVRHGGTSTVVRIRPGRTVADALAKAHAKPVGGQVLSAKTKAVLGANDDPGAIRLHGRVTTRDAVLRRAGTIDVVDGKDSVELTHSEQRVLPPTGLPRALQHVHTPGKAGTQRVTVGDQSGEVVDAKVLTPAVPAHRATGKVIALTFDDGPDPATTPRILEILKAHHVVATFCEVGTQVAAHPELTKRIVREGHQLCNHTVHHVEGLEQKPADVIEAEVGGGKQAILDASGVSAPFYRPPGGSLAPVIYAAAAKHHESVLYWSIDPRDWKRRPADELAIDVVSHLEPGSIILLHDGGGNRDNTVAALPGIIAFARALGYTFTAPISNRSQVG